MTTRSYLPGMLTMYSIPSPLSGRIITSWNSPASDGTRVSRLSTFPGKVLIGSPSSLVWMRSGDRTMGRFCRIKQRWMSSSSPVKVVTYRWPSRVRRLLFVPWSRSGFLIISANGSKVYAWFPHLERRTLQGSDTGKKVRSWQFSDNRLCWSTMRRQI